MKKKELEDKVKELERMVMSLANKVYELEKEKKPKYFG